MFFSDNIRHPKWTEWCNKSEEESTQIAEQMNGYGILTGSM